MRYMEGLKQALATAAARQDAEAIDRLCKRCANGDIPELKGFLSNLLLDVSGQSTDSRVIVALKNNGAELNPRVGDPPLHRAAMSGRVNNASILLFLGADPEAISAEGPYVHVSGGNTALYQSVKNNHTGVTDVLVRARADPSRCEDGGTSVLSMMDNNMRRDAVRAMSPLSPLSSSSGSRSSTNGSPTEARPRGVISIRDMFCRG